MALGARSPWKLLPLLPHPSPVKLVPLQVPLPVPAGPLAVRSGAPQIRALLAESNGMPELL